MVRVVIISEYLAIDNDTARCRPIIVGRLRRRVFERTPRFIVIRTTQVTIVIVEVCLSRTSALVVSELTVNFFAIVEA